MTPQDSVTEGEGWRPLGVQCQVHCTPLMQASTKAAADSQHGCADRRMWRGGVLVELALGDGGDEGDVRSFEFPFFFVLT